MADQAFYVVKWEVLTTPLFQFFYNKFLPLLIVQVSFLKFLKVIQPHLPQRHLQYTVSFLY